MSRIIVKLDSDKEGLARVYHDLRRTSSLMYGFDDPTGIRLRVLLGESIRDKVLSAMASTVSSLFGSGKSRAAKGRRSFAHMFEQIPRSLLQRFFV